jgi:hypothetical protein
MWWLLIEATIFIVIREAIEDQRQQDIATNEGMPERIHV